jgi:hypothetical protein
VAKQQRALAKIRAHNQGGAANSQYIGSLRDEPSREPDRGVNEEPSARSERDGHGVEDDRVWGWNVPWFIADDGHGIWETAEGRALLDSHSLTLSAQHLGLGPPPETDEKLSGDEKRENLVAHFSAMADLEERRSGLSHFRLILSVGREVSIEQLKALVNAYLRENFPLCPAFVAIHDDTEHRHAHIYVQARQMDQRRIDLGQDYFKLDESWMSICAAQLGDPRIYDVHMELKGQTLGWKKEEKQARANNEAIPPKPDRWADHHDTLLTFRPFDDRWCGRLQAQMRVAETRVAWLEATRAKAEEVTDARAAAAVLREKLDSAAERRSNSKCEGKRHMPPEIITVLEARELKGYERVLREVAKGTNLHETLVPEKAVTQAVLNFEEPLAAREGQLGLNFNTLAGVEQSEETTRTPLLDVRATPGKEREMVVLKSAMPGEKSSPDDAARILGRELMAEARLAFIEVRLSQERSRQAKTKLKGELIESHREHAQAQQEAGLCRFTLAAQNLGEPPYQLRADERSYLTFVSRHVSEVLRERIAREVDRAKIIPDRAEVANKQSEESVPREEVGRRGQVESLPHPAAERKQPVSAIKDTKHSESTREQGTPRGVISQPPPKSTKVTGPQMLPDEEMQRLLIACELARGRAAVLLAEEKSLAAMPHHWVSQSQGLTLAQVEQEIRDAVDQKKNVDGLSAARERVRDEIAAERAHLPLGRQAAEAEASALENLLSREASARHRLGLKMPDADPTAEELGEMMRNAVASRDPQLLGRVYEIQLGQALRAAQQDGGAELIRSLEEKMAGVEFMAEVRAHRSERILSEATAHPGKMELPAKDETGRDIVRTLAQGGQQHGVTGFFRKMVEGKADRLFRERLVEAKDASLRYLSTDSAGRATFHEAAQERARDCRERSRQLGFHTPAVPNLSREEVAEARDEGRMLTGARRDRWFTVATRAQRVADERDIAALPQRRSVEVLLPGQSGGSKDDAAREQVARERSKRERLIPVPSRTAIERETPTAPTTPERNDRPSQTRPTGGRGRSR